MDQHDILLAYSFAENLRVWKLAPSIMEAAVRSYFARFTELSYMPWMIQRQAYKAVDWRAYNPGLRIDGGIQWCQLLLISRISATDTPPTILSWIEFFHGARGAMGWSEDGG